MNRSVKETLPGLALALAVAGVAYALGKTIAVIGGPVFGIVLGMVVASAWRVPASMRKGIKFTSKYVLQMAVILLGFEMNVASVLRVGRESIAVIALTLTAAFLTAFFVGRALRLSGKLVTLIGVGTAICGGSAIAAASSAIDAEDHDISYAISTIFLFNVVAVFLFPLIGRLLGLSDTGFGMWAGTAINDTSSVVAAGYSYSNAAGNFATVVKLTRSLMIVPVTLGLAILFSRRNTRETQFSLARVFPWFVIGFLIAAVISSASVVPASAAHGLASTGKFLIIAAMSAIGLNTNLQAFVKAGPRALGLGAAAWLAVMLSSLTIQYCGQSW